MFGRDTQIYFLYNLTFQHTQKYAILTSLTINPILQNYALKS